MRKVAANKGTEAIQSFLAAGQKETKVGREANCFAGVAPGKEPAVVCFNDTM